MIKEYMHIKAINLSDDEEEYEDTIDEEPQDTATQQEKAEGSKQSTKTPTINRFSIDLTKAAEEGKLDPVVGREKEIQRLQEILCRRKKNNPILIGEPGVGKSAIVEGLAQMIADKKVSPILHNKRLV